MDTTVSVSVTDTVSDSVKDIPEKKSKNEKPTLDEINAYIHEKGLKVDGKQFFDYFTEGNWIDSKGNKVKNWKQKLLAWEKFGVVRPPTRGDNRYHGKDSDNLEQFYANL